MNPRARFHSLVASALPQLAMVKPAWLPLKKGTGFATYGSGDYGVAMPTRTTGITMKITTDADEAQAVAVILQKYRTWPVGIAKHYGVFRMPLSHHGAVFVLWRESILPTRLSIRNAPCGPK